MVKYNPNVLNINPIFALSGYRYRSGPKSFHAGDCEEYDIIYLTDKDALQAALPEPFFKVADKPIMKLCYTWLNNADELWGGEYAINTFYGAARFDGERDHIEGDFALMIPETNNFAVCHGREASGDGKFFIWMPRPFSRGSNGHMRVESRGWNYENNAAEWRTLWGIDFGPMKEVDKETRDKYAKAMSTRSQFAFKVITSFGIGTDIAYPLYFGYTRTMEQCWEGKEGEIYFGEMPKSFVMENHVIEAMKKLPVKEVIQTIHWRGSLDAIFLENKGGRLK